MSVCLFLYGGGTRTGMLAKLREIFTERWEWRSLVWRLSVFELMKRVRGSALSWLWIVARPLVYLFCFWFTIELGLRAGAASMGGSDAPYLVWLAAGIFPWMFMQEVLGKGVDVMHSLGHLVNKIKFPLPCVSSIVIGAATIVELILMALLVVIYLVFQMPIDVYLLQVPILFLLMVVFWDMFSMFMSLLSGLSQDFARLINALSTPLFWLSGVIFNVVNIPIGWVQLILLFNPITFFIRAFRAAICDKMWITSDVTACACFAIVFVVTVLACGWAYKRFGEEVPDVV